MKRFSKILICLICLLGFATKINAANYSDSITTNASSTKLEYINGLSIYYNRSGGYNIYSLDSNAYFNKNTYLYNPIEVDKGYAYIINNSDVTNDSYKNYYIANVAILWYEDYLNGNNQNISSALKDSIKAKTNDTICYYITKLVNNAKNYNKSGNLITFVTDEIKFTRNGSYYYSNIIEVNVNGLNSTPSISFYNAPTGTSVINNNMTNNGTGTFQIRIPVSSFNNINDRDFVVNVTGKGYNYTYYKYNNGVNSAIYGRNYTSNYSNQEASMIAKISNINTINLNVRVYDLKGEYISGLKYNVYKGDCSNSTCNSSNLITSFTTRNTYTELYDILSVGTYTFVLTSNTNYNLQEKYVLYLSELDYEQNFTMRETEVYNEETNEDIYIDEDTECDILILSNLKDNTNIIKIYKNDGTLLDSFRSDKESHMINVVLGKYYIKDTAGLIDLEFEMTKTGLLVNGKKTNAYSIIDLDDYLKRTTNEVESNEENIHYDENGNIHIDNLDGVESIDISQNVETSTTIEWLSNIIDCPITSLSSTIKYIIGAIILSTGIFMVVKNVKKNKNNI